MSSFHDRLRGHRDEGNARGRVVEIEEAFWRGGKQVSAQRLAPQSLLVLPPPAGVLDRQRTIHSIEEAIRWQRVGMTAIHVIAPVRDVAILAYEAAASTGDGTPDYRAQCSSTSARVDGTWQLALHQQTPMGERMADGRSEPGPAAE